MTGYKACHLGNLLKNGNYWVNGIKFSYKSNNEIVASYEKKKHKIDEIISKVKNAEMEIYDISTAEGNLEDIFIDLTKS